MNGFWYVFECTPDNGEMYRGRIDGTSDGWDEMGCDLYERLHEAELIPHPELMEAAEADTDKSIALIYHDLLDSQFEHREEGGQNFRVIWSEKDIHQEVFCWDEDLGTDACLRYMDFHGINDERNGWQCCNDHTGCMYNLSDNTCVHDGLDRKPLEEETAGEVPSVFA